MLICFHKKKKTLIWNVFPNQGLLLVEEIRSLPYLNFIKSNEIDSFVKSAYCLRGSIHA